MKNTLFYSLLGISLIFMSAGIYLFYSTNKFINSSTTLKGKVIEIKTMRSESTGTGRPGLVQRPLVEYMPPNGSMNSFIPKVGSYESSFYTGQQVELLYDENTKKVALKSFNTTWLFPIILCGIALLIIGVTALLHRIMPKQR